MTTAQPTLLRRLLALAELAVDAALEYDYGDPEDRHIYRELQELRPLVAEGLGEHEPTTEALPDGCVRVCVGERCGTVSSWHLVEPKIRQLQQPPPPPPAP